MFEEYRAEIQKKIEDAFEVFDHDRGHAVDVRYQLVLCIHQSAEFSCDSVTSLFTILSMLSSYSLRFAIIQMCNILS